MLLNGEIEKLEKMKYDQKINVFCLNIYNNGFVVCGLFIVFPTISLHYQKDHYFNNKKVLNRIYNTTTKKTLPLALLLFFDRWIFCYELATLGKSIETTKTLSFMF